jgi:two-component system, sensor histidine kinase and response regulator
MIDSTLKNARILIVDDKVSNIDILKGLLEQSGYLHYHSTTDPREVISLFKSFGPDLILLDLMMPDLSGFEVMDLLKALVPTNSYLPILVLTADFTIETKLRALSGGAKDFLSKPFNLYEVQLRISNLLETRYLHQQIENQNQILEEKVKERTFELEQANNTLDLANKELAVLDQTKNCFLNLISHEIRTPLNGIIGFTSILKEEIKEPELMEYIQCVYDSAERLEAFSYRALLITELRAGKRRIHEKNVLVSDLIKSLEGRVKNEMEAKQVSIHVTLDPAADKIKGDLELIQICFEQIAANSVKYSPFKGDVGVMVFANGPSIICEFVDGGVGFPEKILKNPFLIFGVGGRHIDNNPGLNMALIKLIMDAHNGRVEIRNNRPAGATVILTFNNQR